MKYILKLIFHTSLQDKFKCVILIVCLSFGMLIGVIFLSQANQAIYSYDIYNRYMNLDNILIVESYNLQDNINHNILREKFDFIKDIYNFDRVFEKIVNYKDTNITGTSIYATDFGFYQCFTIDYPIIGRWFQSEEECVIGYDIAKKYQIKVEDIVLVGIKSYKIAGILDIPTYGNSIMIPSGDFERDTMGQESYLLCDNISEQSLLKLEQFLEKEIKDFQIQTKEARMKKERDKLFRGWGPTITISILSLLYGVVNIINIERFYFLKRKMTYGVLIAYGATNLHIFGAVYFESAIFSMFSSLLTFVFVYFLQFTSLNYVISMRVDMVIFMSIFCISQMYSLLYALFILKKLKKEQIAEIFRNVGK